MAALVGLLAVTVVSADNQWANYKWKSRGDLVLTIGNNVDPKWDANLATAIVDWDAPKSTVVSLTEVTGAAGGTAINCTPDTGNVEICNGNFGPNDWLGVAGIWIRKGKDITKANAIMNDYYFDEVPYYMADADN